MYQNSHPKIVHFMHVSITKHITFWWVSIWCFWHRILALFNKAAKFYYLFHSLSEWNRKTNVMKKKYQLANGTCWAKSIQLEWNYSRAFFAKITYCCSCSIQSEQFVMNYNLVRVKVPQTMVESTMAVGGKRYIYGQRPCISWCKVTLQMWKWTRIKNT